MMEAIERARRNGRHRRLVEMLGRYIPKDIIYELFNNNQYDKSYSFRKDNIPEVTVVRQPIVKRELLDIVSSYTFNKRVSRDVTAENFRKDFPIETQSAIASVRAGMVAKKAARSAAVAAKAAYRATEDLIDEVAENGILKRVWKSFTRTLEDLWVYLFRWESLTTDEESQKFVQNIMSNMKNEGDLPRGY